MAAHPANSDLLGRCGMLNKPKPNLGQYLTSEEAVELARIQKDNSVIGYALLTLDGEEIEASGAWSSMLAPVFGNVFDVSDKLGDEFGEQDSSPIMMLESTDFEVAGVLLTGARAVIIKRKVKNNREGLRSVG